jgi:HD-GYP domain-containing protein (c-di-GMP phosphodiesterase class II)
MSLVKIDAVQPGDILSKSLFKENSTLLLSEGFVLTHEIIELLKGKGIKELNLTERNIECNGSEKNEEESIGISIPSPEIQPEKVLDEVVYKEIQNRVEATFKELRERLKKINIQRIQLIAHAAIESQMKEIFEVDKIEHSVKRLTSEITKKNLKIISSLPCRAESKCFCQHAIDTALLSILIGKKFNYTDRELEQLGTAALLHDIGKLVFPDICFKKISELKPQEVWKMRKHPTYSMLILKGAYPKRVVEQNTILHHHERPDGNGYPQKLIGDNYSPENRGHGTPGRICRYAKILSVANAYDNLINSFTDEGVKHTPQSAISEMVNSTGTGYNIHVLRALTQVIQFYPKGSDVKIMKTDSGKYVGYRGRVKIANNIEYSKPRIILTQDSTGKFIEHDEIDLKKEVSAELQLVIE